MLSGGPSEAKFPSAASVCSACVSVQPVSYASRSRGAINSDPAYGERQLDDALGPTAHRNEITLPERARYRQRLTIDERFIYRLAYG